MNIDKENLRQVILDSWSQFEIGWKLAEEIKPFGKFQSVCFSGMGGSSIPVDIIKAYVKNLREKNSKINKSFSIFKNRGYALPVEAAENCLNIFISYSGNTEETLEALAEATEKKLPSIGIARGGKLEKFCQEKNIPFIRVPEISQPRYALGYFVSILLSLLSNFGLIESTQEEVLASIPKLQSDIKNLEGNGKILAQKIKGKTPVLHVTENLKAVGRIGKIKINENAKTPCFYNYYPELNHNEMVGFTLPQANFFVLSLLDEKSHPQIIKRIENTAIILKEHGIETEIIKVPNSENLFLTLFSSLALLDWISYYLAIEYGQDPTPVQMVEDFKKQLA